MRLIRCEKCGLALEQRGDQYICPGCGAKYAAESARRVADEMARLLDEQKQERVANLRQQLWKEFNEEFYDRAEISRLAKGILNILPDDFFAQFCALAAGRDMHRLNAFLYAADVRALSMYVWDMLSFLLRPLREETLTAVNDLLSRAREAELDRERFNKYNERLAAEAQKLDAGVYDVTLPRDVFLAYSSADMAAVGELAEALEAQKISCFVAVRNLQHGAIQNYEEQLHRAMDHCRTVVFVSSKNSRSRTCDVLKRELPYLQERDLLAAPQYRGNYAKMPAEYKKPRLEYLLEEHTGTAADAVVEEFFAGCEYCYDAKTAAQRILKMLSQSRAPAVKYCLSCGAENSKDARFCSFCGGQTFADTREKYEQSQRAKAEAAAREAEAVRRAEEEKNKAETERRRAEEEKQRIAAEKKRAEEENAALRAEVERLRKAAQEAAAKSAPQQTPAQQPVSVSEFESASKQQPAPAPVSEPAKAEAEPESDFEIVDGVLVKYRGKGGDVVIPDGVREIEKRVFVYNDKLISITIPDSVISIGECAFRYCKRLKRIAIGNGVKSIGRYAFAAYTNCSELTEITIPKGVTEIGEGAFQCCYALQSIAVEAGNPVYHASGNCLIKTATKELIAGCKNSVIPADGSVTSIAYGAFSWIIGLTIIIPDGVKSIASKAFESCNGLSITIPESVTRIGVGAFAESRNVNIYCTFQEPAQWPQGWYAALKKRNIVWGTKAGTVPKSAESPDSAPAPKSTPKPIPAASPLSDFEIENGVLKKYKGKGGEVVIPSSVTSIGEEAFSGCTEFTSITIPDSVTNIGNWAFNGCTGLTSITIPNSVMSIGDSAFKGCTGLTSITIPDGMTSIGNGAFKGCAGLTNITIPNSVTKIGWWAFYNCHKLEIHCRRKRPLLWPKGWDKDMKEKKTKIIWDS